MSADDIDIEGLGQNISNSGKIFREAFWLFCIRNPTPPLYRWMSILLK